MKRYSIILLRLSLIVLVITLFMNFGNCYAYTWDEFLDYCELITQHSTNTTNKRVANWILNNKTTIYNKIPSSWEYSTLYVNRSYQYGGYRYSLILSPKTNTFNWNAQLKTTNNGNIVYVVSQAVNASETIFSTWYNGTWNNLNMGSYSDNSTTIGLLNEEQADELNVNFSGKEWNNFYEQWGINYLEFNNSFIDNTTHNGNLFTYYFQGDFYSNNRIQIGSIIPNDSYYYEIYLKENSSNLIKGTIFCNVANLNIYNGDGALFLDDNQNLYVTTRLLNYSTQYKLEITSYYGDGGDNLYEDIDWIIFLPQNATFSGDYILSFGSGDFTEQDNANQIIDNVVSNINDMSNVSSEIDTFISGDLAGTLGFTEYDSSGDIWRATIINFTDQVADALMYSGDPYYDISLHGETPVRIYASNFTTPETPLKIFVRLALIFGCLYAIYFQLFTVFNLLTCGAPDEVIGNLAPDIYLYRM